MMECSCRCRCPLPLSVAVAVAVVFCWSDFFVGYALSSVQVFKRHVSTCSILKKRAKAVVE